MHNELLNGTEAVTPIRKPIRELAERTSNGTRSGCTGCKEPVNYGSKSGNPNSTSPSRSQQPPSARSKSFTTRTRMPPRTLPSPWPPNSTPRSRARARMSRNPRSVVEPPLTLRLDVWLGRASGGP